MYKKNCNDALIIIDKLRRMIMYTVKELIKELEKYPPNTIITIDQTNDVTQHISHTYETKMYNGWNIVCIKVKQGDLY